MSNPTPHELVAKWRASADIHIKEARASSLVLRACADELDASIAAIDVSALAEKLHKQVCGWCEDGEPMLVRKDCDVYPSLTAALQQAAIKAWATCPVTGSEHQWNCFALHTDENHVVRGECVTTPCPDETCENCNVKRLSRERRGDGTNRFPVDSAGITCVSGGVRCDTRHDCRGE